MEKNIEVMRKTIIVLTLLVGILIGALIGNPMEKSEADISKSDIEFVYPSGNGCFAIYKGSITFLGRGDNVSCHH